MQPTATRPTDITIRPIRPGDRAELERFYAGLSTDAMNARFHGATRGISTRAAQSFCGSDHEHREGLVAVAGPSLGPSAVVGHLCLEPAGPGEVELAIAVADRWQRHGIGRALMAAAVGWARVHGVMRLRASLRWSNAAILGLLRSVDRPLALAASDDGDLSAVIDVGAAVPVAA